MLGPREILCNPYTKVFKRRYFVQCVVPGLCIQNKLCPQSPSEALYPSFYPTFNILLAVSTLEAANNH